MVKFYAGCCVLHLEGIHSRKFLLWGNTTMYQRTIKRFIDIVLSLVGLIVLAIPMLVFALIVKLDSPGPVLFWQKRAGLHKQTFTMPRFRTDHVHRHPGQYAHPSPL